MALPSLSDRRLRDALAKLRGTFESRVQALAEGLGGGRIELADWQRAMQTEVRRYHLAAAAIGAGTLALTDAALVAIAQRRAAEQVAYLNNWADEMAAGSFPVDATPRIRQRATLYAGAALATFERARGASQGIPATGKRAVGPTAFARLSMSRLWAVLKSTGDSATPNTARTANGWRASGTRCLSRRTRRR